MKKEKKKKKIDFFTTFYIFHENGIKIFLKWTLTNVLREPINMSHLLNMGQNI